MDKAVADRVEGLVRSAFPEGAIERVQLLAYGDDPEVEPGETAIRVLTAWSGQHEGKEAAGETLKDFHEANRAAIKKLRGDLPSFIGWIEFRPDRPADPARPHGPMLRLKIGERVGRGGTPDEVSEELTPVMTRLWARRPGDRGHLDHCGHREQPGRGFAVGSGPHPRAPCICPAPGAGARDRPTQDPVLTDFAAPFEREQGRRICRRRCAGICGDGLLQAAEAGLQFVYFDDPGQTRETLADAWYHSGDLAVRHPDGYIELRDRKKDIIISGGENISTIEVETAIARHPAVADVAVVSTPDQKWGERPKASSSSKTARTPPPKTSSPSPKSTSPATCGRPRSRSPNWPRQPPARSRRPNCATRNGKATTAESANTTRSQPSASTPPPGFLPKAYRHPNPKLQQVTELAGTVFSGVVCAGHRGCRGHGRGDLRPSGNRTGGGSLPRVRRANGPRARVPGADGGGRACRQQSAPGDGAGPPDTLPGHRARGRRSASKAPGVLDRYQRPITRLTAQVSAVAGESAGRAMALSPTPRPRAGA